MATSGSAASRSRRCRRTSGRCPSGAFIRPARTRSIKVYADLRDAVAWLQGVAVIRGDTADECVGVDFGEQEYLTVLEFLQCMSNIVINDGGTGLFSQLQVGTLLHGDKYVFVTEASQLGFWSIGQVFSRYRNYEGEKDRPLTEREKTHLNRLMDEATIVVDKFSENDPEQARWLDPDPRGLRGNAGLGRGHSLGPGAGQPGDRWILVPSPGPRWTPSWPWPRWCCAESTGLTADGLGLPDDEAHSAGNGQGALAEPPRWFSEPERPAADTAAQDAGSDAGPVRSPWPTEGVGG